MAAIDKDLQLVLNRTLIEDSPFYKGKMNEDAARVHVTMGSYPLIFIDSPLAPEGRKIYFLYYRHFNACDNSKYGFEATPDGFRVTALHGDVIYPELHKKTLRELLVHFGCDVDQLLARSIQESWQGEFKEEHERHIAALIALGALRPEEIIINYLQQRNPAFPAGKWVQQNADFEVGVDGSNCPSLATSGHKVFIANTAPNIGKLGLFNKQTKTCLYAPFAPNSLEAKVIHNFASMLRDVPSFGVIFQIYALNHLIAQGAQSLPHAHAHSHQAHASASSAALQSSSSAASHSGTAPAHGPMSAYPAASAQSAAAASSSSASSSASGSAPFVGWGLPSSQSAAAHAQKPPAVEVKEQNEFAIAREYYEFLESELKDGAELDPSIKKFEDPATLQFPLNPVILRVDGRFYDRSTLEELLNKPNPQSPINKAAFKKEDIIDFRKEVMFLMARQDMDQFIAKAKTWKKAQQQKLKS